MRTAKRRSAPWKEALAAVEKSAGGLIYYNIRINNRRTAIRLDAVDWSILGETAIREGLTVHELITRIKKGNQRAAV